MKKVFLFFLIVIPIVALLGFGLTRNPNTLPSVLVGKVAPTFSVETLDGKTVTLESLSGTPMVINFWATWCGPCFAEHPVLLAAREQYESKGVRFFGVVYQDELKNVKQFLESNGTPFTVLIDPKSQMAINYGVGGVPETFFIDSKGIIRDKLSGSLTPGYLQNQIEKMTK